MVEDYRNKEKRKVKKIGNLVYYANKYYCDYDHDKDYFKALKSAYDEKILFEDIVKIFTKHMCNNTVSQYCDIKFLRERFGENYQDIFKIIHGVLNDVEYDIMQLVKK